MATLICRYIEKHDCKCWLAPRDITHGRIYAEAIVEGIEECSVFLLVLTANAQASEHVARELERAASKVKNILTVRLDKENLRKDFEYFVRQRHWFDASDSLGPSLLKKLAKAAADLAATPAAETSESSPGAAELGRKLGFQASAKKPNHILFEIRGKATLSSIVPNDRRMIPHIIDGFTCAVPGSGIALVGMNLSPLTVQFSSSLEGFEKLRCLYLTRSLAGQEEYHWNKIERLDEPTASKPWQANFSYSADETPPDDLDSVVCHLDCINEHETEGEHASQLLGSLTRCFDDCRVYIYFGATGWIYAHSNYVKEGYFYPTKLYISKRMSLFTILKNLTLSQPEAWDDAKVQELQFAHANRVKYFVVERYLLDERDIVDFFCGAQNIEFVAPLKIAPNPDD